MKILAIALALIGGISHAQVNVVPVQIPHPTFFDQSGAPCAGCNLYTYLAGTTTPSPTYTDASGTSQNTNPIVLNVAGGANVWVASAISLKFVLKDTLGSTIWTVDQVKGNATNSIVANPAATQTITQPVNTDMDINTSGTGKLNYNNSEVLTAANGALATDVVKKAPSATQPVVQPDGTTLSVNDLNSQKTVVSGAIQATITSAGTTESLGIPATYAGTDSYNNPNDIKITDQRAYFGEPTFMRTMSLLSLMTAANHGDDTQAQKCAAAGACNVVFWGDSITEANFGVANEDGWPWQTTQLLKQAVPQVTFTSLDLGIGGTGIGNAIDTNYKCGTSFNRTGNGNGYISWPSACASGSSWNAIVQASTPDILFIAFGQNDAGGGGGAFATSLNFLITQVQGWTKPPTIVLVSTFPNTLYQPTYSNQQGLLVIGQVIREIANRYGLLLVDSGRLFTLLRDGYDPYRNPMNFETSFMGYPTGWSTLCGGSLATSCNAGSVSGTTVSVPSGPGQSVAGNSMAIPAGGGVYARQRNANDTTISATFTGLNSSSKPTFLTRLSTNDITGFGSYQTLATWGGSNWTISFSLAGTSLTSGTCAGSVSTLTLVQRQIGSRTAVYCNGSNTPAFTVAGGGLPGYPDYTNPGGLGANNPGYYAIGVQATTATVTEYTYVGGIPAWTTFPVSQHQMLGVYSASDLSNGDYFTNPFSIGGNGINHPTIFGHDGYYTAAALPVILQLQQDMRQRSVYGLSTGGSLNNGVTLGGPGYIVLTDGEHGGAIHNNADNVNLEHWDDNAANPHIFNRPIQVGASAKIITTSDTIPLVTGSITANKATCIKTTSPIVIGVCSTVVDASGNCTCN